MPVRESILYFSQDVWNADKTEAPLALPCGIVTKSHSQNQSQCEGMTKVCSLLPDARGQLDKNILEHVKSHLLEGYEVPLASLCSSATSWS